MSEFKELCNTIIDEGRSVVVKRRSFYPRKIEKIGGLSPEFVEGLGLEMDRLQQEDPSISMGNFIKAINFELGQH